MHVADQANINENSYSNLGNIYELPSGKDNTWLAGSNKFRVLEMEVFTVRFL
jgi:hypothetical protein